MVDVFVRGGGSPKSLRVSCLLLFVCTFVVVKQAWERCAQCSILPPQRVINCVLFKFERKGKHGWHYYLYMVKYIDNIFHKGRLCQWSSGIITASSSNQACCNTPIVE